MIVVFCHFFWFMSQVPILVSEWTDIGLRFSKSFGITKEVSGTLFYVGDCFLLSSIQLVFDGIPNLNFQEVQISIQFGNFWRVWVVFF